ncbi:MAG TPA: metalloregulator ArsR/SmtB family transcription factor [Candidatus Thermoplasmatota archaeon]|nr:metalloregulator ArsR/SmtB family transcription factor [Candidatus Thermoplasmatota archaeon]
MDAVALLRLVSEGTRHAILDELRKGDRTVGQLVTALSDEQSNVSHHLGTLREAGLVVCRRDGRHQHYRLADAEVARVLEQVESLAGKLEQLAYTSSLGLPVDAGFHGYG